MTRQRKRALLLGGVLLALGLLELLVGLVRGELFALAGGDLLLSVVGFGPVLSALGATGSLIGFDAIVESLKQTLMFGPITSAYVHLLAGMGAWIAGWLQLSWVLRGPTREEKPLSEAAGKPLFPRLANFRDLHWGTLAAYGFGMLLAEFAFVLLYLAIVSQGAGTGGPMEEGGLSPVWAFVIAFFTAMGVAFAGGFLGAANSQRLSVPEATMAILYFGLPVPGVLTAMHHVPSLMLLMGHRVREIAWLSAQLGEARPELGYWLVTIGLVVALFLGINLGFVSTSSGKLDLRTSYEGFIATRQVAVFRPRLLLGAFAVLILGIVPPLLLYFVVMAAEKVVERTRIRRLGLRDPLAAAEALNEQRLRRQSPTGMMTALSVGGVGVGVMALIIVLSVMSGFEADLQKKILGTNSHGVVLKYSPDMPEYEDVLATIKTVPGVTGETPFILNEVMVSSEGNISGSMIKGIDPKTVGSVTDLPAYMLPGGSLEGLEDPKTIHAKRLAPFNEPAADLKPAGPPEVAPAPKEEQDDGAGSTDIERDPLIDLDAGKEEAPEDVVLPGIVVGRELAASLKVVVGDRINVVSPLGGELGPQGPMPKSRPFRVAGIFYSGMFEYDSKFVYIHLREAQSFFGVKGASGIEIKVKDVDNARSVMKSIYDKLEGYPYRTKDWGEMNRNLFAALRLEKLVMAIILTIIVIVAAGLIVATVIMLVLEKRKEIAVLKALGVPDGGIVKIFLAEGLQIGIAGGLLGLVAGLAWCFFIEKVGIKLDPQVYYIPALPVRIEPFQTALSVVIAVLVTFLASIYPALTASEVEPVEGLKSE